MTASSARPALREEIFAVEQLILPLVEDDNIGPQFGSLHVGGAEEARLGITLQHFHAKIRGMEPALHSHVDERTA